MSWNDDNITFDGLDCDHDGPKGQKNLATNREGKERDLFLGFIISLGESKVEIY